LPIGSRTIDAVSATPLRQAGPVASILYRRSFSHRSGNWSAIVDSSEKIGNIYGFESVSAWTVANRGLDNLASGNQSGEVSDSVHYTRSRSAETIRRAKFRFGYGILSASDVGLMEFDQWCGCLEACQRFCDCGGSLKL